MGIRGLWGLDALAIAAASVWTVLILRLVIPRWLKGLSAAAIITALAIVTVAGAMTVGTFAQMHAPRMLAGGELVMSWSESQVVLLTVENEAVEIWIAPEFAMPASGRASIAEYLSR